MKWLGVGAFLAPAVLVEVTPALACGWDPAKPCGRAAAGADAIAAEWPEGASFSHLISLSINNYDSDCNPWLTSGETEIFFIRHSGTAGPADSLFQGDWDIYHADWDSVAGEWGPVTNLGPAVNTASAERRPTTTADGDTLLFSRGATIHWAVRTAGSFSYGGSLFNGSDPCLSSDARELYYVRTSDIWVAERGPSGAITDWVNHHALSSAVNSAHAEVRPYISRDDTKLFFSDFSDVRPGGYGGADLWVCEWDSLLGDWGSPMNVGPPINVDRPACTPWFSADGKRLYTSSESFEGSRGTEDVWVAYADSVPAPEAASHSPGTWVQLGELGGAWNVYDIVGETSGTLLAATAPEGAVYRSTDAGTSWQRILLPGVRIVYSLLRATDGTLYAGTYPHGAVLRSTDDGLTWSPTSPIAGATAVRALLEKSDGTILAGDSPLCRVHGTTDSGATWIALAPIVGLTSSVSVLHEVGVDTLLAGGWGSVIDRSTDGGASWSTVSLGGGVFSVESFTEDSFGALWMTGWSHDDLGFVWRSDDAGLTWTPLAQVTVDSLTAVRIYDLVEPEPGSLLVGFQPGPERVAALSTDGGLTWAPEGTLTGAREILRFHKDSQGVVYAATTPDGDVFRYAPGGVTGAEERRRDARGSGVTAVIGGRPNPFRTSTRIAYQLASDARAELSIVDVAGRRVRTLESGFARAGFHAADWDGRDGAGRPVASGVYFARLRAGDSVTYQRLVRIR